MVNVNVSESAWKFVTGYKQPGESFAETLDRVLLDWKVRGDRIGELDEICLQRCRGNPPPDCSKNPYNCEKEEK